MFEEILKNVNEKTPLVHMITNYVTVNDCANVALACGGSPIMADDELEVEDITSICNALVINIGTLNERTVQSMIKAGKKANELGHPVVLDPVGAGASNLRTKTTFELLKEVKFSAIRGNISEIKTVWQGSGSTKGVDASDADEVKEDNIEGTLQFAKKLAKKLDTVIAITGAIDIITNGETSYEIRNGHPLMSKITGTGCMLSGIVGCFLGANCDNIIDATAAAVALMGICGEKAYEKGIGTSSFKTKIIDSISNADVNFLNGGLKIVKK